MNKAFEGLEGVIGRGRVKQDESLESHTIQKVVGRAEFYTEIEKTEELIKIVRAAQKFGVPVFMLGGGSRIKVSKDGISGLVIKNNCRRFDKMIMSTKGRGNGIGSENVLVFAEAGTITNQLVRYTIEEGLEGLEYQLGLPGTVGGAIYTNAKYMPKYFMINKAIQSMRILHEDGDVQVYNDKLPHFVYVDEGWQETKDLILSAVFKLTPMDKKILWERGKEAVEYRTKAGARV
jgi:UDP-N-acetylmuramate dehydrogenase